MRLGELFIAQAASVQALDTGADVLLVRPTAPILVVRFGFNISVECTGTSVMKLDKSTHILDGTPTRVEGAGGQSLAAVAQEIGGVQFAEPDDPILVKPGDILHWQVEGTGYTAGDGFPWIQYQQQNWAPIGDPNSDYEDAGALTRLRDGSTDI